MQIPADSASFWIPTDPGDFWTMVAAIVSAMLFVVAALGLRSLRLAKDELALTKQEMRTRAERDAVLCAMERCKEFATFIQRNTPIFQQYADNKIPVFVQAAENVQFDTLEPRE